MSNEALQFFFRTRLGTVETDIEACELQMIGRHGQADAISALNRVQAKYEAVADQLEAEIKLLK